MGPNTGGAANADVASDPAIAADHPRHATRAGSIFTAAPVRARSSLADSRCNQHRTGGGASPKVQRAPEKMYTQVGLGNTM